MQGHEPGLVSQDDRVSNSGTFRPDGKNYIDELGRTTESLEGDEDEVIEVSSGSSVEENEEEEAPIWSEVVSSEIDVASNEQSRGRLDGDSERSEEGWEVEDEDWELAHGDFTKQYNRLRQQHAAVQPSAKGQKGSSSARPPLPARNVHPPLSTNGGPGPSTMASKKLISYSAFTGGVAANPKSSLDRHDKDKSDRATQEQVLDSRTRLVLSSLAKRGVIGRVEYCISTGKEASDTPPPQPSPFPTSLAVKIYRTSILNFRARQDYIVGEHRFRGEYTSAKNPRKMVRLWAEKELRNLKRLEQGGIRAPRVIDGKENVLVMEFLGDEGQLKDADIPLTDLSNLYLELLAVMRRMFHQCKLVHADLSEYNVLYHKSHLYMIDVSQSVEHDHPRTFDFLRNDIRNITDFFARRSVDTLSLRRTWDFIVSESLGGMTQEDELGLSGEGRIIAIAGDWVEMGDEVVEKHSTTGTLRAIGEETSEEARLRSAGDEAVFMSSFIPRSLAELHDPERNVEQLNSGEADQLIYSGMTGLKGPATEDVTLAPNSKKDHPVQALPEQLRRLVRFEVNEDQGGSDEKEEAESITEQRPRGFRHENKEAKKIRKQAVRDEKREKRTSKISKTEKQRLIKQTAK